ncbi:Uma2 family endonuclease [Kribbella amoyensis]|uniref:Uma2 family endonuclease n=1 Tax=Kribbella amoyensis TaxID=996641 RepID=A0A561BU18_9ACTN|nr:Uma2 family endonuclease [Kribbella amoyensis]TWD82339.1 Uma2 family endonuclease [Kribbella amoyensis]
MTLMEFSPDEPKVPWRPSEPLTKDDLDRMPDDGHRYEVIDGTLLVTPAPSRLHQRVVAAVYRTLFDTCPANLEVLFAPFDVVISPDTVLQPDVLVARREDFTDNDLPKAPLLAVEVLSASTKRIDVMLKWSRLEAAGCPAYWVVDPDTPSLIGWELRDGAYAQVAKVAGDEPVVLTSPYDVTVVPADLIL